MTFIDDVISLALSLLFGQHEYVGAELRPSSPFEGHRRSHGDRTPAGGLRSQPTEPPWTGSAREAHGADSWLAMASRPEPGGKVLSLDETGFVYLRPDGAELEHWTERSRCVVLCEGPWAFEAPLDSLMGSPKR